MVRSWGWGRIESIQKVSVIEHGGAACASSWDVLVAGSWLSHSQLRDLGHIPLPL